MFKSVIFQHAAGETCIFSWFWFLLLHIYGSHKFIKVETLLIRHENATFYFILYLRPLIVN